MSFLFPRSLFIISRNFCNSSNLNAIVDDPRKLLGFVRHHSQLGFHDLHFPLSLFHHLISLPRRPSIVDFNRLFSAILKLKRLRPHSTVISLYRQLEFFGIRPDSHSIGILINCYSHLGRLDFGFSLLGKSLKLGYPFESDCNGVPHDIVIYNILINSLCEAGKVEEAGKLVSDLQSKGLMPDGKTYNIMIKGVCKKGHMSEAIEILNKMTRNGCSPDEVTYNTIIKGFIHNKDLSNALRYRDIMVNKGFEADVDTISLFLDHLSHDKPEFLQKFLK